MEPNGASVLEGECKRLILLERETDSNRDVQLGKMHSDWKYRNICVQRGEILTH